MDSPSTMYWTCSRCKAKFPNPAQHVCFTNDEEHFNSGLTLALQPKKKKTKRTLFPDTVPMTSKLAIITMCMNQFLRSDHQALAEANSDLHGLADCLSRELVDANNEFRQLSNEHQDLQAQTLFREREFRTFHNRATRAYAELKRRLDRVSTQLEYVASHECTGVRVQKDRSGIPTNTVMRVFGVTVDVPYLPPIEDETTTDEDIEEHPEVEL